MPTPSQIVDSWREYLKYHLKGRPAPTGLFAEFVRAALHWENW